MFYGGLNGDEYCDDWGPHDSWEPGEDRASYASITKTCKHCGQTGLHWIGTTKGWRLGIGGRIHDCPVRPTPEYKEKRHSSKVYDLLSNAIQGNHLSEIECKEFDRLKKYFKDNGITVNDLLKKT